MSDPVTPIEAPTPALEPDHLSAQPPTPPEAEVVLPPLPEPSPIQQFLSRNLAWITAVVSIGIHGIILSLPLAPEKPPPEPTPPEETQVRITQLPTQGKPAGAQPEQVQTAAVPAAPNLAVQLSPTAPPRPSDPLPAETPAATTPTDEAMAGSADLGGNPWEDFPQYPGAQPGCYNLASCLQTGKPLTEVSTFFEHELTAKKYAAELTINEPNRKVFQVSRNGLTQYLSLINVEGKGTLYVLSEAPRTLADLAQAIEVPGAIYSVLSNLYAEEAGRANFTQPDAFFTAQGLRPEVGIAQLVTGENYAIFFDTYFRNNLVNNGFESSNAPQSYGGGLLYTVTKDDLTLYPVMLPTADGTGTLVVVLKSLPE